MPRNEFQAGDHEEDDTNFELEVCRDEDGIPFLRKVYPGKGTDEDQSQEVAPVEEDPHMWPAETEPTLADLRKSSGATTTEAHLQDLPRQHPR